MAVARKEPIWQRWFASIRQTLLDRRVRPVLITYVVALFVTALIAWITLQIIVQHHQSLYLSFLASWSEDLLFFALVGSVVWYVALRDPANEDFDRRVKFLYGNRLPESILGHAQEQIKKLGGYSPEAKRTIVIERYDPEMNAYLTLVTTTYRIVNALDTAHSDDFTVSVHPDVSDKLPEEVAVSDLSRWGKNPILLPGTRPSPSQMGSRQVCA